MLRLVAGLDTLAACLGAEVGAVYYVGAVSFSSSNPGDECYRLTLRCVKADAEVAHAAVGEFVA